MTHVVNVSKWLEENQSKFKPPVCNSMMSDDYIKIMWVGGPNSRKDYHLDQGEEFFFMLKGDMLLKVMEKGEPKDVHIREGEVFCLPSRVPHSPQRFENTLGLVVERKRKNEYDGLRYYCEDGKTVLWQKFFMLNSLVVDLPPVFNEYFNSEQYKTGVPIPGTTGNEEGDEATKFITDKTTGLLDPFKLEPWIEENIEEIQAGRKVLFNRGEFEITVYGSGKHEFIGKYECWFWHKKLSAKVEFEGKAYPLGEDDSLVIPGDVSCSIEIEKDGYGILVTIDALHHINQGRL